MEITKQPKPWTKKMLCPKLKEGPEGCGCRFKILAEDVRYAENGSFYVNCPTCGRGLVIDEALRLDIRQAAERRFRKTTSTTATEAVIA